MIFIIPYLHSFNGENSKDLECEKRSTDKQWPKQEWTK